MGQAEGAEGARAHEAEERRLAYVAVTRARQELHVSYAEQDEAAGEMLQRSRFVDELASVSKGACAPTEVVEALLHEGDEALWAQGCAN
mmetsp:Transcript_33388/g.77018  ORF Transcript_33388/g.77018 Transcript_33388/m.77018 type:complete len:89 (+) Transcript_33388:3-269(+)